MKIIETCSNVLCQRPFQVNKYANVSFSVLERGRISCPHCGTQHDGDGDAIFMTHALAAQEEADYIRRYSGTVAGQEFAGIEGNPTDALRLSGMPINSDFLVRHSTSFSR